MSKYALLYAFLGSNVGDVAVTRGAIEMVQRLDARHALTVIGPKLGKLALNAWKTDVSPHHPYAKLVEWDFKNLKNEGEVPKSVFASVETAKLLTDLKIDDADTLIYAGGEHLFSYGKPDDDWSLFLRLAPFFAASAAGKNIRLLPSTFGPFETDYSRSLAKRFLSLLPDIPVRDVQSQRVLNQLGFDARYCLDPAFFVQSAEASPPPSDRVANIIMRLDKYGLRVGQQQSLSHAALLVEKGYENSLSYRLHRDVAKALAARGFRIRLFIQTRADEEPTKALHRDLSSELGLAVELVKPTTVKSFIEELGHGSLTVTSRFHGAIFSLLTDRPVTSIFFKDHGHKMPGLFEGLGISNFCFDGSASSAGQVADTAVLSCDERSWNQRLVVLRQQTLQSLQTHFPKTGAAVH